MLNPHAQSFLPHNATQSDHISYDRSFCGTSKFNFLSFNARSLFNKMDEIAQVAIEKRPSLIAICETWANPLEPDSLYELPDYSLYRHDRQHCRGGGVAVYVHSSIPHKHKTNITMSNFESLWLELDLPNVSLTVGCSYRPPNTDPYTFCQQLEPCLGLCNMNSPFLLVGDMNAKHTSWLPTDITDRAGDLLSYLLDTAGLNQHVSFPTCISRGNLKSCLDVVISNVPEEDLSVTSYPPVGASDHVLVGGHVSLACPPQAPTPQQNVEAWRWNWDPDRVVALKEALSSMQLLPPAEEIPQLSMTDLWSHWHDSLINTAHLYCTNFAPRRTHQTCPGRRPWMTQQLLCSIKLKHQLYRQYLRNRSAENWLTFVTQRNRTTTLLREAKSAFVSTTTQGDVTGVPQRNLYKLMKSLRSSPKKELPPISANEAVARSDGEKAEAFNNFFISESQKSVSGPTEAVPEIGVSRIIGSELKEIITTQEEVRKLLSALDFRKSAGYDGIPTKLLKITADEISCSLATLFNESFSRGEQPQDWRDATISPLHKKASRAEVTNYRPISLLSVVSKVQERIVHQRLYTHIEPHLPADQSGFRSKDSTELQLSRLVHEISASRDSGQAVSACFFDLSKAFDRVWHAGLLAKLEHLGVRGIALTWLTSYLTRRRQRVKVGSALSSWKSIPAGVPQGSVLGPLLFLVYTIDLPPACTNSHTKCSQFADDTALIATHYTRDLSAAFLQRAVDAAGRWLKDWHLLVNTTKTVVLSFQPQHTIHITLHSTRLQQVHQHRHLGVTLQDDLRWTQHIIETTNKAKKLLHQLHKTRSTMNASSLLLIYTTYIRPVLEYGSLALSNTTQQQRDTLERIQRRAIRICLRIPLFAPVHHSSLLHHAKLPTLSSRLLVKQALLAWDIHHQTSPPRLQQPHLAPQRQHQPYTLRQTRTYSIGHAHTNRHRDSPINSALTLYNSLPIDITTQPRRNSFRNNASSLLLSSTCSCSAHPPGF